MESHLVKMTMESHTQMHPRLNHHEWLIMVTLNIVVCVCIQGHVKLLIKRQPKKINRSCFLGGKIFSLFFNKVIDSTCQLIICKSYSFKNLVEHSYILVIIIHHTTAILLKL